MYRKRWIRPRRPVSTQTPARPRGALHFLGVALRRLCIGLGAGMLIMLMLSLLSMLAFMRPTTVTLPDQVVLYINFKDGLVDLPDPPSLTDPFADNGIALQTQIAAIDRAATDPRVKGLVAVMESGEFAFVQVQEMHAALTRFRASGKFMYIYSSSYGETASGLGRFYLASAFEKRWMQPLGIVSIPGVRMEMPFFYDALHRFGIEPQFFQRKTYKTIFESAMKNEMSPQNREMLTGIIDDLHSIIVRDMAVGLKITPGQVEADINKGLFTATEALQAGLITDANYEDVLYEKINRDLTGDPAYQGPLYIDIEDYARVTRGTFGEGPAPAFGDSRPGVALVYASGIIMETADGPGLSNSQVIAADELAPVILGLAEEDWVKAIVLRIDSPGGSPVASETILRALARAKQKNKKVIVSMGATAASGGYWIASNADRIFAMPATLTGSIGVAGGKISTKEMWNKWNVNWESIEWGKNAALWSLNEPYSPGEAERINAMMDQVYDAFIARVAEGRKLSPQKVEEVAQGRVWTGQSAIGAGLVDEIGGLNEALNYAAITLGAKDQSGLDIRIMPKPKSALDQLRDLAGQGSEAFSSASLGATVRAFLKPLEESLAVFMNNEVVTYDPLKIH